MGRRVGPQLRGAGARPLGSPRVVHAACPEKLCTPSLVRLRSWRGPLMSRVCSQGLCTAAHIPNAKQDVPIKNVCVCPRPLSPGSA